MKKYLFILATTAIVASCADQDSYKKDIQNGNGEAISFETFATKQTRATENSDANYSWAFFDHHTTFQVWGFKNTSATAVFNGDVVTVAEGANSTYTYTYSPIRYWDKAATSYQYYAAAPSEAGWTFNGATTVATQDAGYFTTSSTLKGTNIADGTTNYYNSFKGAKNSDNSDGDIDKLIAAPKVVYKAHFSQPVQLNFVHILSRLNVTIKKDEILENQTVIVKKLEVHNLKATGAFNESTAASQDGNNTRWTESGSAVTYAAPTNTEVTAAITSSVQNPDPQYLIQSLVIPQDAEFESVALDGAAKTATNAVLFTLEEYNAYFGTNLNATQFAQLSNDAKTKIPAVIAANEITASSKPYLVITYTIQDGSNTPEEFTAYFNLAATFGMDGTNANNVDKTKIAFNEGWQNTLHITLSPDAIEFCATVAEWSTNEEETLVVD
jgi:hypothetical protein